MNASRIEKLQLISARLYEQLEYLDQVHSEECDAYDSILPLEKSTKYGDSLLENSCDLAALSFDLECVIKKVNELIFRFELPF